jgi:hypothetical protein
LPLPRTKHTTKPAAKTATGGSPVPRFDLGKLHMQFCPAAQAELNAKKAVLDDLRQRAKSAGKRIWGGPESIVGLQQCNDVRWLFATLRQMSHEFAAEIDEDLEKLSQPGADREYLVGHVYTVILCIRATHTLFFGNDGLR